MKKTLLTVLSGVLALPSIGIAHEFWIAPEAYSLEAGAPLTAQVRSGENFEGVEYPYMPDRIVAARLHDAMGEQDIVGIAGHAPAIRVEKTSPASGLQIISYQSTGSRLLHTDWQKFLSFLSEDGLQWVQQAHEERGLSRDKFSEMFTRYSRSLIFVEGDSPWQDESVGLRFELLVLERPMSDDPNGMVNLQLIEEGRPVAGTQITVFRKQAGESADETPEKFRSDENGIVSIPQGSGGEVLASAVVMKAGVSTAWHSHWFRQPSR